MRKALLMLAALTATVAAADEPNWVRVSTAQGARFVEFVDTNSLQIRHGHLSAWFLKNYDQPQDDARKPYVSAKTLRLFDCAARSSAALTITRFSERGGRGKLIDTQVRPLASAPLKVDPPDSVGQEEVETVCEMWGDRAV